MNYLNSIALTRTLPCLAEPGKIIVVGKPSRPLDQVLPYMATLPGVISWNPQALTLTFRRQPGFLTLSPDQVHIIRVTDLQEGLDLLEALKDAINTVWEKREELVAVTTRRSAPHHLDIWGLLPRSNCKQCGEATCLAFAVALIQGNRSLEECLSLQTEAHFAVQRSALFSMLSPT
jgi:ArsR family metal-binding transcriptional regulator